MAEAAAFARALRAALLAPLGAPLRARFGAAAQTAIVAEGDGDAERMALRELSQALERAGVPRGRQFVLLAPPPDAGPFGAARRRALAAACGVAVLEHDPQAGPTFLAGRLPDGTPLELDDELREAEAIVLCAAHARDGRGRPAGGPWALAPGLASAGCRQRLALLARGAGGGSGRAWGELAAAILALQPVEFALFWRRDPLEVLAGDVGALMGAWRADGGPQGSGAMLDPRASGPLD